MIILDVILSGIVVGGMYALIAMGLNLQYGVARIMNLSYGEFLMTAAFSTFWLFTLWKINPLLSLLFSIPVAFIANWLIYRVLLRPLPYPEADRIVQLQQACFIDAVESGDYGVSSGNLLLDSRGRNRFVIQKYR